jgi:4-hydroxybenzoate polyprenyltransferase
MRLPIVVFWVWINLLPFAIDNQRQSAAILEDKYNKPWRTMPSGRMTQGQAKTLMICLYLIAYCASLKLGGVRQCLSLMALGFAYNDLNLANWSWFSRNAINALGFCCFTSGALEVVLSTPLLSSPGHREIIRWLGIIAVVVASTVQMQDMGDQEGDRMRGRKSLPLTVGDGPARWMTAVPMVFWSAFCPLYWRLSPVTSILVGSLGLSVAYRILTLRGVGSDRWTFRIWNIWMAHLYALPLVAGLRE